MEKKFRITVDGRPYNVSVEELADSGREATPASMAAVYGAATPAPVPSPAAPQPAAGSPRGNAGPGDVTCTLGGVVEAIEVAVGQAVAKGARVVVIEAMKMKTPMLAHRDGSVTAIAVKLGQAVEPGQVLLTIG